MFMDTAILIFPKITNKFPAEIKLKSGKTRMDWEKNNHLLRDYKN